jgi:uncharacterized membrane protein
MKKPVSPLAHGIIDYGFVLSLLTVPQLMKTNRKAAGIYRLLGLNLGIYNAITDHGASIKPLMPFRTHYKIDQFNIALVAALALKKSIRRDNKALLFHGVFVSLAFLNVLLTDARNVNEAIEEVIQ